MLIIDASGKNIDSALKILKNKFSKTKTVQDLKERKTFKRRGEKRREVLLKAKYRNKKIDSNH